MEINKITHLDLLPCILFEDDDLLVVNKPVGWNTHSPDPYLGEGIYNWLRNRSPKWVTLATVHRLDKDTSGVMVFAKTKLANKSLTEQFSQRSVDKQYLLCTDRKVANKTYNLESRLERSGNKYIRSNKRNAQTAITRF